MKKIIRAVTATADTTDSRMLDGFKVELSEMGYIGSDWKLVLIDKQIIDNNGDWAVVVVESYKPRCRKPSQTFRLMVNFVRKIVDWSQSFVEEMTPPYRSFRGLKATRQVTAKSVVKANTAVDNFASRLQALEDSIVLKPDYTEELEILDGIENDLHVLRFHNNDVKYYFSEVRRIRQWFLDEMKNNGANVDSSRRIISKHKITSSQGDLFHSLIDILKPYGFRNGYAGITLDGDNFMITVAKDMIHSDVVILQYLEYDIDGSIKFADKETLYDANAVFEFIKHYTGLSVNGKLDEDLDEGQLTLFSNRREQVNKRFVASAWKTKTAEERIINNLSSQG